MEFERRLNERFRGARDTLVNIFHLNYISLQPPRYLEPFAGNQRCCFPSANFPDNAAYRGGGGG